MLSAAFLTIHTTAEHYSFNSFKIHHQRLKAAVSQALENKKENVSQ